MATLDKASSNFSYTPTTLTANVDNEVTATLTNTTYDYYRIQFSGITSTSGNYNTLLARLNIDPVTRRTATGKVNPGSYSTVYGYSRFYNQSPSKKTMAIKVGSTRYESNGTLGIENIHVSSTNNDNDIVYGSEITNGELATITIKAKPNFIINSATFQESVGSEPYAGEKWNFNVANDGSSATFQVFLVNAATISIDITDNSKRLEITTSNTNVSISTDPVAPNVKESVTITVNTNTNYTITENTTPTITGETTNEKMTVSTDRKSATITFTPTETPLTINVETTGDIIYNVFSLSNTNFTATGITDTIAGSNLNITLTPNEGYQFSRVPSLITNGGEYTTTLHSDGTATYSGTIPADEYRITIYAPVETVTPTPTPTTAGFIRIFTPSNSVLDLLSDYEQINPTTAEIIDLTKYIYGLYHVYAPLKSSTVSNIYLSHIDTGIESTYEENSICSIESEEIELTHKYGNIYDYSPFTDSKMYLPFIGYIDTDTNVLYAGKIKIKYDFNLLNMDTLATVFVDGVEMYRGEGKCGYNIPFNLGQYSYNTGNFDLNGYMFDLTPKIILTHSTPYENGTDKIGKQISSYIEKLSSLRGLNRIADVKFSNNSQILNSEKEEIISLLANGVYF